MDPVAKKWAATTSPQASLAIYKNTNNGAHRIVALGVNNNEVIINAMINKDINPQRASDTFSQFQDTHTKDLFGINFHSKDDNDNFLKALETAQSPSATSSPAPAQNKPTETKPQANPTQQQQPASQSMKARESLSSIIMGAPDKLKPALKPTIKPTETKGPEPKPTETKLPVQQPAATQLLSGGGTTGGGNNAKEIEEMKKEILSILRSEMATMKKELLEAIKNG